MHSSSSAKFAPASLKASSICRSGKTSAKGSPSSCKKEARIRRNRRERPDRLWYIDIETFLGQNTEGQVHDTRKASNHEMIDQGRSRSKGKSRGRTMAVLLFEARIGRVILSVCAADEKRRQLTIVRSPYAASGSAIRFLTPYHEPTPAISEQLFGASSLDE
jgi:hypothetical protein